MNKSMNAKFLSWFSALQMPGCTGLGLYSYWIGYTIGFHSNYIYINDCCLKGASDLGNGAHHKKLFAHSQNILNALRIIT